MTSSTLPLTRIVRICENTACVKAEMICSGSLIAASSRVRDRTSKSFAFLGDRKDPRPFWEKLTMG
jgi:hypothetical protein